MLSFHNDPLIKEFYLNQVREHYDADEIIKGIYWENGKGCAVGCTVHSSSHKDYEIKLGIPEEIAYLQDGLFERLPPHLAKEFPLQFIESIPVGKDLSKVINHFLIWLLIDPENGIIQFFNQEKKSIIRHIASLHQSIVLNQTITEREWQTARAARDVLAGLVALAGGTLAELGASWAASWVALAAGAAGNAGELVAIKQRDKLLELLKNS